MIRVTAAALVIALAGAAPAGAQPAPQSFDQYYDRLTQVYRHEKHAQQDCYVSIIGDIRMVRTAGDLNKAWSNARGCDPGDRIVMTGANEFPFTAATVAKQFCDPSKPVIVSRSADTASCTLGEMP